MSMESKIEMSDYLLTGVRSIGLLSNNKTILNISGKICVIEKQVSFCTGKNFDADSGVINVSIPFELDSKDAKAIENAIDGIRTSNQCSYKNFNNAQIAERYKKHDFTAVDIDGDCYTVPKNSKYLADLSKIYMPEIKRYINLSSLKII